MSDTTARSIQRVSATGRAQADDVLAIEEPLEIRLNFELGGRRVQKSISITMRTPGMDFALAAGFLFTEGIVKRAGDIARISYCTSPESAEESPNIVRVELQDGVSFDPGGLQRNFYATSSCGVCGKASLEALYTRIGHPLRAQSPRLQPEIIHGMPGQLRAAQACFEQTGGLHAAGLFSSGGELLDVCEDVGRHNAVDKLIGRRLLEGLVPLHDHVLLVSGRTSFEILQKALMAGLPIVAAISAPSSLAVDLAGEYGLTLLGFVRDDRFNIYTAPERIMGVQEAGRLS